MNKPSYQEYMHAKDSIKLLDNCISRSTKRIMELIDELTKEKKILETYKSSMERVETIMLTYEEYEKLESKE